MKKETDIKDRNCTIKTLSNHFVDVVLFNRVLNPLCQVVGMRNACQRLDHLLNISKC